MQVSAEARSSSSGLDLGRLTEPAGPLRRQRARACARLSSTLAEGHRADARPHRRHGGLKSAFLYRRHDVVRRTVGLLTVDDVAVSFDGRALAGSPAPAAGYACSSVGFGVSIPAKSCAWGVGLADGRVTARGLERAARAGLRRLVRSMTSGGCELSTPGVDGSSQDHFFSCGTSVAILPRG